MDLTVDARAAALLDGDLYVPVVLEENTLVSTGGHRLQRLLVLRNYNRFPLVKLERFRFTITLFPNSGLKQAYMWGSDEVELI